jgi:hypothetical protein
MVLLGELAIRALDRRSRGTPLHPQDLIGVAHSFGLLAGIQVRAERPFALMWCFRDNPATGFTPGGVKTAAVLAGRLVF